MATEPITIATGWNAFVKDGKTCLGIKEFKLGGKYWGTLSLPNMLTLILIGISFLGGVYVGARYSEKLLAVWHSITGK